MVSRKYTSDYRLDNVVDPRTGKISTRPVYCGVYYRFCADAAVLARCRRLCALAVVLLVACYLTPLLLNAPSGHMMYVMLPLAAMVFPVYYLGAGCWRLLTARERVTREHRDKTAPRLRAAGIAGAVLSGASTVGQIVYCCIFGATVKDGVSLAATVCVTGLSALLFSQCGLLTMEPVPQGPSREAEDE